MVKVRAARDDLCRAAGPSHARRTVRCVQRVELWEKEGVSAGGVAGRRATRAGRNDGGGLSDTGAEVSRGKTQWEAANDSGTRFLSNERQCLRETDGGQRWSASGS